MADVWEKDLAQKSSLTTSDYIRVVGSDNVSYKQGIPSVLNLFNNDAHSYKGAVTVDDYNDITDTGFYYAKAKTTTLNPPISSNPGRWYQLLVTNTDGLVTQFATSYNDPSTIYSRISADGSTWSAWVKQPTRAEIDALNSKIYSGNTTTKNKIKITAPDDTQRMIKLIAGTNGWTITDVTIYAYFSNSGGVVRSTGVLKGTQGSNFSDIVINNTSITITMTYNTIYTIVSNDAITIEYV